MTEFLHVPFWGGVIASIGGLVAQLAPADPLGQGGFWIGVAGLITASGSVWKMFLDDRQKARAHEIDKLIHETDKLKIVERADANRQVLIAIHGWLGQLSRTMPGKMPPLPKLPHGYDEDQADD